MKLQPQAIERTDQISLGASSTTGPACTTRALPATGLPNAEPSSRPGAMRRVVSGRRVQVEMLGADGSWSPVFCYTEPPADSQVSASSSS